MAARPRSSTTCATTRPSKRGAAARRGDTQIRTGDGGFADPCLTTWLCRRVASNFHGDVAADLVRRRVCPVRQAKLTDDAACQDQNAIELRVKAEAIRQDELFESQTIQTWIPRT